MASALGSKVEEGEYAGYNEDALANECLRRLVQAISRSFYDDTKVAVLDVLLEEPYYLKCPDGRSEGQSKRSRTPPPGEAAPEDEPVDEVRGDARRRQARRRQVTLRLSSLRSSSSALHAAAAAAAVAATWLGGGVRGAAHGRAALHAHEAPSWRPQHAA